MEKRTINLYMHISKQDSIKYKIPPTRFNFVVLRVLCFFIRKYQIY
jgi:hypothetical protein